MPSYVGVQFYCDFYVTSKDFDEKKKKKQERAENWVFPKTVVDFSIFFAFFLLCRVARSEITLTSIHCVQSKIDDRFNCFYSLTKSN